MSLDVLAAYERRIDAECESLAHSILSGSIANFETYKAKCDTRLRLLRTKDTLKEVIAKLAREELE